MNNFLQLYSINDQTQDHELDFNTNVDDSIFKSQHWGQRKLLCIEIYFLIKAQVQKDDIVVYVGAASGQHIVFLANLFPEVIFHLYDIEPFSKSVKHFSKEHPEKMICFHRLFDTNDALNYNSKFNNQKILFISDIRCSEIDQKTSCLEQRENYIAEEMMLQKNWATIIQPRLACFKFRLRFNQPVDEQTEYFDGQLLLQPWSRLESAELRLITDCKTTRIYNYQQIERKMVYHNLIKRNEEISTLHPSLYPYFDVQMEYDIWKEFLLFKHFPVRHETIIQCTKQAIN